MIKSVKNGLVKVFGRKYLQNILERNVFYSQYLMGIGSGGSVESSGETIALSILKRIYSIDNKYLNIFDVGSNVGQFINIIISNLDNIPYFIHSFEPSLYTYNILTDNMSHHGNVVFNNVGLGKTKCESVLYYDKIGSGTASLTKRRLSHMGVEFKCSELVSIDTVDSYCLSRGIEEIDFLKMDTEGHELDVLAGAESMLKRKKIKLLSFEFGGCNIDTRTYFRDFWYFFKSINMSIHRITPSGNVTLIDKYDESHEQYRTTNFIVASNDIVSILKA